MSSRLLYSCRMTGNDNKAPLAKISLSASTCGAGRHRRRLIYYVFTCIQQSHSPQICFLLVSRVNKIDVVLQTHLRNRDVDVKRVAPRCRQRLTLPARRHRSSR